VFRFGDGIDGEWMVGLQPILVVLVAIVAGLAL
jgi:hypothetical protein